MDFRGGGRAERRAQNIFVIRWDPRLPCDAHWVPQRAREGEPAFEDPRWSDLHVL